MIIGSLKGLTGFFNKLHCRNNTLYDEYRTLLQKDPLNTDLHIKYAKICLEAGNFNIAFSEYRTALALGAKSGEIASQLEFIEKKLPNKKEMEHNQYYRFTSLAREVRRLCGMNPVSILDVGGGVGLLSQFVPDDTYCLVEPTVNGISGTDLPFADGSFDCVVSCHVLEHVPPDERELFLKQLLSKAKKALILLNPFHVKGSFVEERLNLLVDITEAEWAKEHLACKLPQLELIEKFAEESGLNCRIKPNGTLTTSMAMVFLEHFSAKMDNKKDIKKINSFYNALAPEILDSNQYPTAHLVTISRP